MEMMKLVGDIAYFVAIVGINFMLIFLLTLTKWRATFVSIAITAFFGVVAIILDLSAAMLFIESIREFIRGNIRTPMYVILAVSIWTLFGASIASAIRGARGRRAKKIGIAPPEKEILK